jgi:uncharacterized protein (DUF58 family)
MSLHPRLDDLLELRHQARTLGLASHHLVNSAFSGLYASVFRGYGLDFEEVREYKAGDDIRNMDWHVTARTDVPHLKVFREERERSVMLCVDHGPHMSFGTHGTFKSIQAARAAALIGWAANSIHDRVGGLLFGSPDKRLQYFRPTRGRRALWRILRAMSEPGGQGRVEGAPLLDALHKAERGATTGTLIFVIAALDRDVGPLERTLGRLRQRHSVALLPVDDVADWEIPAMGRVIFTGPDGELLELDTDDEHGRQAYRAEWERRREFLRSMAHRLGITLIPLRTDEDVHRAMMDGLRRRVQMRVLR